LSGKEDLIESPSQIHVEAAREFAAATVDLLKTERGVHAETAVAAAARMAGTFLFRSFEFPASDIEPGQAVLSDRANEQGPMLVSILGAALSELGASLGREDPSDAALQEAQPNQSFLDTQRVLEPSFRAIADHHGLTQQDAAHAAALATAFLIQDCSTVLDPGVAFNIAVYGFIEGTKTAPDPVSL
jgi:hypothetical protein